MEQTMKLPASSSLNDRSRSARLFRNGANQAVRIPREFELACTEVIIRQVAGTLVIEPAQKQPPKGSVAALLAALETLESISEPFPDVDQNLLSLDDISL
jgi:antitoxin VapB